MCSVPAGYDLALTTDGLAANSFKVLGGSTGVSFTFVQYGSLQDHQPTMNMANKSTDR